MAVEGDTVSVSLPAPSWGYRLLDLEGSSRGANPVRSATFSWELSDGTVVDEALESESTDGGWSSYAAAAPADAVSLTVTDAHGNAGQVGL